MADRKIGFVVTHAADDPERATLPFMVATVAITMGVEPVIILQGDAVALGIKERAMQVSAEGLTPVDDLIETVLGAGFRIMVCSPCLATRGIAEADLREGVFIGGAAKIVEAMESCSNFLTY